MKKPLVIGIVIVIIALGAYAVFALNGSKDPNRDTATMNMPANSSSTSDTSAKPVTTNTVTISNFAFSPAAITVKVGTKVTWTNEDSAPHTVTADTVSSDAPASNQLGHGESYTFTFTKAGTYNYHCEVHPDMKAKVVVTE